MNLTESNDLVEPVMAVLTHQPKRFHEIAREWPERAYDVSTALIYLVNSGRALRLTNGTYMRAAS